MGISKNYNDNQDIINIVPEFKRKNRMARENRAKIFAPFAALKGYGKAIAERQKITVAKAELAEDTKEELDLKIQILLDRLWNDDHPVVTLVYFNSRENSHTENEKCGEQEGQYIKVTGMLTKIDIPRLTIQIVNQTLSLGDIYSIESDIFD